MARGGAPGEQVYQPETTATEAFPRKVVPEMPDVSIGPSISAIGDVIGKKYQADSATYAGNQLAQFRLSAIKDLEDAKAKAPAGDPGDFTGTYLAAYDKKAAPLVDAARGNPYARAMIEQGVSRLRDSLYEHTLQWEATQRKAAQVDALTTNLQQQLPLVRAHPEIADQVGSTLHDQVNLTGVDPAKKQEYIRSMDVQLTHNAALGVVDRNPEDAYHQLAPGGEVTDPVLKRLVDPASRQEVFGEARRKTTVSVGDQVAAAYRAGGPAMGAAAYNGIDKLPFPDDMKDDMRKHVHEVRSALIAEQQQKLAPLMMHVEEGLKSGEGYPGLHDDIRSLYRQNALEPHAAGAMLGQADAIEAAGAERAGRMAIISEAWNRRAEPDGPKLDPGNKDQVQATSDWFDDFLKRNNAPLGSQMSINIGAEFAKGTGIVPAPLAGWMRSALVASNDPNQVVAAADALDRLRSAAPRAFNYLEDHPKLRAMADSITDLTKGGMSVPEAVQVARADAARGENEKARLQSKWRQDRPFGAKNDQVNTVLRGQLAQIPGFAESRWYGSVSLPDLPQQMLAEYATNVRKRYDYNGGNAPAAELHAARDIASAWGIDRSNGEPQIFHLPPTKMFPGLKPEHIRAELANVVDAQPEAFQQWDYAKHKMVPFKVDPEKVQLVETRQTALTGGIRWGLQYDRGDGVHEAIFDQHNQPLEYDLPVKSGELAKVQSDAFDLASRQALERKHARDNASAAEDQIMRRDAEERMAAPRSMKLL